MKKEKILVAIDFSKLGEAAAQYGFELAKKFDAQTSFMHVVPEPSLLFNSYALTIPVSLEEHLKEMQKTAARKLEVYTRDLCNGDETQMNKCERIVTLGDPAKCIVEYAREHSYDMIVLGHRSHSTFDELLVGSTALKVMRYAPCSVLVYRPEKANKTDEETK